MKQICLIVALILLALTGCKAENDCLQQGIALRDKLTSQKCSFTAKIVADYEDKTYSFAMGCSTDADGNLSFIVKEPQTIAGIAGNLTGSSGYLTFDDTALAFPLLADGEVSPVSGPWLLINTLRSGYLAAAGEEGSSIRLTLHDSYEADSLLVDVWLDENSVPQRAEILWQGRRVLSLHIEDFLFV